MIKAAKIATKVGKESPVPGIGRRHAACAQHLRQPVVKAVVEKKRSRRHHQHYLYQRQLNKIAKGCEHGGRFFSRSRGAALPGFRVSGKEKPHDSRHHGNPCKAEKGEAPAVVVEWHQEAVGGGDGDHAAKGWGHGVDAQGRAYFFLGEPEGGELWRAYGDERPA